MIDFEHSRRIGTRRIVNSRPASVSAITPSTLLIRNPVARLRYGAATHE